MKRPNPSPVKIYNKLWPTRAPTDAPDSLSKVTCSITPKTVMAMISSKLEAAIRVLGIPFTTPYPLFCRIMMEGTRTAGETAAIQNPRAMLMVHCI